MKKFWLISLILLGAAAYSSNAQESVVAATANINYRVDKTTYDPAYMGNAAVIERLRNVIDSLGVSSIDSMNVYSYASPEGSFVHNIKLAKLRSEMTGAVLKRTFPELRDKIFSHASGESWEALRDYVTKDTKLSEGKRSKILEVIDADVNPATKQWRMQNILGTDPVVGDVYKYLYDNYYKIIRNSTVIVFRTADMQSEAAEPQTRTVIPSSTGSKLVKVIIPMEKLDFIDNFAVSEIENGIEIPALPEITIEKTGRETIFALKTNLLYDALTMVNFEVEVPIAKHYSVMVEDIFPWWEFSKNKYALQNWEIGVEGRYWFKPWTEYDRKLEGFFAGPYGMSAKYDIQYDTKFCWQGYYWSAGLTAGYSKSLGRKHWGDLEFSLSAGYVNASYQHYQPAVDYSSLIRDPYNTGRVSYFGPTKAKVSLVIPIRMRTKRSQTIVIKTNEQ